MAWLRRWRNDRGSAPAEFVMVGALLALLTLSVLQVALALHVRNTLRDAAAEGARVAALAGNEPADGIQRTRNLIDTALGDGYARHIHSARGQFLHRAAVTVTVRSPLPLIGLVGINDGLEVSGHAAIETVDEAAG